MKRINGLLGQAKRWASLLQVFGPRSRDLSLLFRQIMALCSFMKGKHFFSSSSFFFAPVVDIDLFDVERDVFPVGQQSISKIS